MRAAAIQFVLRHDAVSALVAGAMRASEVRANAAALRTGIPEAFWREAARISA